MKKITVVLTITLLLIPCKVAILTDGLSLQKYLQNIEHYKSCKADHKCTGQSGFLNKTIKVERSLRYDVDER